MLTGQMFGSSSLDVASGSWMPISGVTLISQFQQLWWVRCFRALPEGVLLLPGRLKRNVGLSLF
jgi:APA family basic amino acid/polyamine antiporter